VSYRQPIDGYRTGIEPVLLAASVPARSGQRVVEAGTGAGAGLLCLLARVAGLSAIGIERDADMAALARRNLADNAMR
jgi:tRNA1Val (adenine37-N6)-methyltransferase